MHDWELYARDFDAVLLSKPSEAEGLEQRYWHGLLQGSRLLSAFAREGHSACANSQGSDLRKFGQTAVIPSPGASKAGSEQLVVTPFC